MSLRSERQMEVRRLRPKTNGVAGVLEGNRDVLESRGNFALISGSYVTG
ncbi:MAG: hypothetical protein AAGF92_09910 [Myxococcota bacterium]